MTPSLRSGQALDARAWLGWTLGVAIAATTTRNPLCLIVVLLIAAVVDRATPATGTALPSPLRLAALVVLTTAVFNGLIAHFGDTVLVALPDWLPLVGGAITLEALIYGATNGLTLATIYAAFAALNRAVPARELLRLAPRALQETSVVVSIALAFVPETMRSLSRLREAQAVRGHRARGVRDWPPIAVPLVVGGLERSTGLAEAMVARGYGATADRRQPAALQALIVVGLAALLGGWLGALFVPAARLVALAVALCGLLAMVGALWLAGRAVRRTSYRDRPWRWRDSLVVLGTLIALAALLVPLPFVDASVLAYNPYPVARPPAFDPIAGIALLGLLAPTLLAPHTEPA